MVVVVVVVVMVVVLVVVVVVVEVAVVVVLTPDIIATRQKALECLPSTMMSFTKHKLN